MDRTPRRLRQCSAHPGVAGFTQGRRAHSMLDIQAKPEQVQQHDERPVTPAVPLFRVEAVEAAQSDWLGEIALKPSTASWLIPSASVLVVVSLVALLTFGSYQHRSRVSGELVPAQGLIALHSPMQGYIEALHAEEGDQVRSGQILAVVGNAHGDPSSGYTAQAQIGQIHTRRESQSAAFNSRLELLNAERQRLTDRRRQRKDAAETVERELSLRNRQLDLLEDIAGRVATLGSDGLASTVQVREAEGRSIAQRAEIEALSRQLTERKGEIEQIDHELGEFDARFRAEHAAHELERSLLSQEEIALGVDSRAAIRAPVDGVVSTRLISPGQNVETSAPLLVLMPADDQLEAHMLVPSRAIGSIKVGDPVRLRFQAFPYQHFGHREGHVRRISRNALALASLPAHRRPENTGDTWYRIVVGLHDQYIAVDGVNEPLLPGMAVEADVFGERRRLIRWLFAPLMTGNHASVAVEPNTETSGTLP